MCSQGVPFEISRKGKENWATIYVTLYAAGRLTRMQTDMVLPMQGILHFLINLLTVYFSTIFMTRVSYIFPQALEPFLKNPNGYKQF